MIIAVCCKAVIDTGRYNNHIILFQLYPNPLVAFTSDIEETDAISNVSNLFVLMQMLVEKHLHLLLIDIAHLLRGDSNHIAILVAPLLRERVHVCRIREVVIENIKFRELLLRYCAAGIVEFTLVDFRIVIVIIGSHVEGYMK